MTSPAKFGTRAGDGLRWDGEGNQITEAAYRRERQRRRTVANAQFTDEEAKRQQDSLRTSGLPVKE